MQPIIECVPNFSEGRNPGIIQQITEAIQQVEGVRLLNVDPGKATHRTVVTFVGNPEAVVEAAFRAIQKAGELIDMSTHTGAHPRMGATDVCPLIPVSGITMEETARYAIELAQRVGEELQIPVYLYESAQKDKSRSNLSVIRAGEYEGFFQKIQQKEWKPDFGPAQWDKKRGGTVIGARDFLIAYNVNLNTTSVRRANAVAFDVREAGRVKREGNSLTGKIIRDDHGNPISLPGTLKSVKAIGWYIEEYGIAQISMNLTNMLVTPIHKAFDEVCQKASERGLRVTGSELVGLVPLKALTEAGKYFLHKQRRSSGVSEKELVRIAIKSLGLEELSPFKPEERIIEYLLQNPSDQKLVRMPLDQFVTETASESPAPGGGSVSALLGALGAALGTMVANLSSHKKGWDDRWEFFSDWAEKGQASLQSMLRLVDADTQAFNRIMEAFALPKSNESEIQIRNLAVQEATRYAIEIPVKVMETANLALELVREMADKGNPNSVSDAGVGALCCRSAILGAYLNVQINAAGCTDTPFLEKILPHAERLKIQGEAKEKEILEIVTKKISGK